MSNELHIVPVSLTDQPRAAFAIRALAAGTVIAAAAALRKRYFRWGATDAESAMVLPGDELLPITNVSATRAITVRAAADDVWPWLAQIGQAQGGFYSYDFLENLVNCDIHSADKIHPEWQDVAVGDVVLLAPELALTVAVVEPRRALVLCGGIPMGAAPMPYEFSWAFLAIPAPNGTTRVVVRERYHYTRGWAPLIVQPAALVSCLMSRRMLLGIKQRAERAAAGPGAPASTATTATTTPSNTKISAPEMSLTS